MHVVVQNLVLVLCRTVIHAAIAALANLPFKLELEIIRDFSTHVDKAAALPLSGDDTCLDLPITIVLPILKRISFT